MCREHVDAGGDKLTLTTLHVLAIAVNTPSQVVTVTCSKTGGLPTSFEITVTGTAGSADCQGRDSTQTSINAVCCTSAGTAYARGGEGFDSSTQCFDKLPQRCRNWGFANTFITNNTNSNAVSDTYTLIAGSGNDCKGGSNVGSVKAQCVNNAQGQATVTFSELTKTWSGSLNAHFYVGCQQPSGCTPPNFGARTCTSTACGGGIFSGTVSDATGGLFTSTGRSYQLSCPCSKVSWVFHEPASFIATRNQDGTCPA
jgi:hypothetical protein